MLHNELLLKEAGMPLIDEKVYAESFGHTEYQIKEFVINNRDFPTEDAKARQCRVELWARFNSANDARFRADTLEQDIIIKKAGLTGDFDAITRAQKKKIELEIEHDELSLKMLRTDYDNRILREAAVFAELLHKYKPSEKSRYEAEKDNWEAKAELNPKVKALMEGVK